MKLNRILKYAAVSALVVSTGVMTMGCTDNFEKFKILIPMRLIQMNFRSLPNLRSHSLMSMLRSRTCSNIAST